MLRIVLAINLAMFAGELTAAVLARSTALLADSADMLGDAMVYGFSVAVVGRGPVWQARAALLKGLVMGLEFVKDKQTKEPAGDFCKALCENLVANGVICGRVGWWGQVLRIAPPLVITLEQAEQSLDALEKTLGEMTG